MAAGRTKEAVGAFEQGVRVTPESRLAQIDLKNARAEAAWKEKMERDAIADAIDPTLGLPLNYERRARQLELHLPPEARARLPKQPQTRLMNE